MKMTPEESFVADQDFVEIHLPPSTDQNPLAEKDQNMDQEEAYGIEELFFSRTDERGVIQSFNDTFQRIAGFDAEALQGAPHKLVRHGDMPKAVFWLLWNGLKAGVPVGAYVKNRTKSGKYYWVYAVASPIDGGFLSVRMKPSSPLFEQVQTLYEAVLNDEAEQGLSPEDSAHRLLDTLKGLGFASYAMFQAQAFYTEFEARRSTLDQPKNPVLASVDVITRNSDIFQTELAQLARQFDHAVLLITNMEIVANKQEEGKSVIREIARNYSLKMRGIQAHLDQVRVRETFDGIWGATRDQTSYFLLCAAQLMEDMNSQFAQQGAAVGAETDTDVEMTQTDSHLLNALLNDYRDQSVGAVKQSVEAALAIKANTELLQTLILSLSNIRIACRVEMARLINSVGGLDDILDSLDAFHTDVDRRLATILGAVEEIVQGIDQSVGATPADG